MARKTFNVLFFIKKARLLKNGEAPVCMRITVNGCMVDISIKRSCPVNLWNQAKENSKGKDRMSVELNHYLEIIRSRIHKRPVQQWEIPANGCKYGDTSRHRQTYQGQKRTIRSLCRACGGVTEK